MHVVGEGALRGRSPCTREGRIGPTAELQWSVVSSQLEWIVGMGPLSTLFVGAGFGAVREVVLWLGGCGQAQGLPLRERLRGKTARVGGCGQAQGLPLQERLRGKTARVGGRGQAQGLPLRERLKR